MECNEIRHGDDWRHGSPACSCPSEDGCAMWSANQRALCMQKPHGSAAWSVEAALRAGVLIQIKSRSGSMLPSWMPQRVEVRIGGWMLVVTKSPSDCVGELSCKKTCRQAAHQLRQDHIAHCKLSQVIRLRSIGEGKLWIIKDARQCWWLQCCDEDLWGDCEGRLKKNCSQCLCNKRRWHREKAHSTTPSTDGVLSRNKWKSDVWCRWIDCNACAFGC